MRQGREVSGRDSPGKRVKPRTAVCSGKEKKCVFFRTPSPCCRLDTVGHLFRRMTEKVDTLYPALLEPLFNKDDITKGKRMMVNEVHIRKWYSEERMHREASQGESRDE